MTRALLITGSLLALLGTTPGGARAQAPFGSARLIPAEIAESLAVLKDLDEKVRANSKDAAIWFRRGMIAWSLSERQKQGPSIQGLDANTLRIKADESLRTAVNFEPDNAYYRLMAGRLMLSSGVTLTRAASYGYFEAAVEAARKSGDPYVHSETAIEAGRIYWRRYDGLADRWIQTGNAPACGPFTGVMPAFAATSYDPGKAERPRASLIMRAEMTQCALPDKDHKSGEADYLRTEELFREAFQAQPSNQRAYQQLAMLLVERNRWTELAALARARVQVAPWDAWAWLTLGLSLHRQKSDISATLAAYDSAFTLLPPEERQRMNRLERIFSPRDSLKFSKLDPTIRFATNRAYWLTATPLWSQPFDEPQLEFLSRVTYAELRWTVAEMNVRGADTDRGDVYIRFGAPDLVASFKGSIDGSSGIAAPDSGEAVVSSMMPGAIFTKWVYDVGLVFTFAGMPTFATARIPQEDQAVYAELVSQIPVRWARPGEFHIDSMPVQVARFRAKDSIDVLVATRPPVDSIARGGDAGSAVRADLWLLAGGTVALAHDSVLAMKEGLNVFTNRVPPHSYLMRTEVSAVGSQRAARASAAVGADSVGAGAFPTRGFGMSDVLIATNVEEGRALRRWTDLGVTPLVGSVATGSAISLLWENYDFKATDGGSRYNISISLRRDSTSTSKKSVIAAKITSAIARTVGIDQGEDRLTLSFDRAVPYAPIMVDNISLTLTGTPPGKYQLTVLITDLATNEKVARTTALVVRE